jgi:hypothetical protein
MYIGLDATQAIQRDRQRRFETQAGHHRFVRMSDTDLVLVRPRRPRQWPWLWLGRAAHELTTSPLTQPTTP